MGIKIISVGIGSFKSLLPEIQDIVTEPVSENAINITDFTLLDSIIDKVFDRICTPDTLLSQTTKCGADDQGRCLETKKKCPKGWQPAETPRGACSGKNMKCSTYNPDSKRFCFVWISTKY